MPLDDLIAEVKSDYTDVDLTSNTVDGHVHGIKVVDDMGCRHHRKSLLDKAGVRPPTTRDELIVAAEELTTKDVKASSSATTPG